MVHLASNSVRTSFTCFHLRQILGIIGIEDVQTARAEGMNIPPLAIYAGANGEKAIEALVI